MTPRAATPEEAYANEDGKITKVGSKTLVENFPDESTSSLKRANRPPDLDLSPGRSAATIPVELANQKLMGVAAAASLPLRGQLGGGQGDFDPGQTSTPTKHSGSISERISLVYKKNACKGAGGVHVRCIELASLAVPFTRGVGSSTVPLFHFSFLKSAYYV